MKRSKQDIFNQYRENLIIEIVQTLAKSEAGSQIAFKGGTALKLFWDLPRYSEDIDYDFLSDNSETNLFDAINSLCKKNRWEITDDAVKHNTILFELRFPGPERSFRIKIEISTREKEFETTILLLRGVPILTLTPSFLMTEKLFTFIDRQAGRDFFDAWFIIKNAYPLDERMIQKAFGNQVKFYQTLLMEIENADSKKILQNTGKLLDYDNRNWIKTSFLSDFKRLVRNRIAILK